jgi:serine/threonine protein kinase HipA of HipAB toxin-antitoxin module
MKDRIKEGLRRILASVAERHLFDRTTSITNPVTKQRLGVCKEKLDYIRATDVPPPLRQLRLTDDFATVSEGEFSEVLVRYQKEIILNPKELPRVGDGQTGVTDIIRVNVDRFLRDMDEPVYALEYVDLEDLSVGRIKAAKSYQVDVGFRFHFFDAEERGERLEVVRLVIDRNGIKRMIHLPSTSAAPPGPSPVRSVA